MKFVAPLRIMADDQTKKFFPYWTVLREFPTFILQALLTECNLCAFLAIIGRINQER